MKKLKLGLISMLALLLVVLTGCQAIGGVDLNKVLTNNMGITSYEGSSEISINLITKDGELGEEEAAMVQLLNNFSIVLDDIKMQDYVTMSMSGAFKFAGEELPFTLSMDEEVMVIDVDGAKKPIVVPLNYTDPTLPAEFAELQQLFSGKEFTEDMVNLVKDIGGFFIEHFPNPASVNVTDVTESIGGEQLSLKKVDIEIKGSELISLVQKFLKNVLADEEGLNEVLGALYDAFAPILIQVLEITAVEADDASVAEILPYLENKDLAVGFLFTFIQSQLAPIVDDFENNVESWIGEEAMASIFNDNNVLTNSLYIDSNGDLRKQDFELTFALGMGGIETVQIFSSNVYTKINGEVKADKIDTTDAFVLDENASEEDFKALFEEDSLIYNWIEQLDGMFGSSLGQFVILDMSGETEIPGYEQQPYIKSGVTMVPVRYVSEELSADVSWNQATREVTVTDEITGASIVLTVDNNIATVNGENITLEAPAELKNGSVFVPVRFIAESLGAEVIWEAEIKSVIIIR